MSQDSNYYARRALEERGLAMASADPKVRRIHLELAGKYAALAGADATIFDQNPPEAERRTA